MRKDVWRACSMEWEGVVAMISKRDSIGEREEAYVLVGREGLGAVVEWSVLGGRTSLKEAGAWCEAEGLCAAVRSESEE